MDRLIATTPLLRAFCFPFAAGSAAAYNDWSRWLPPYVSVVPLDYPGHGRRFGQRPLAAIDEITSVFAREIMGKLEGPFAFFGHSMGALVAFELARELRRRHAPLPRKIYVAASRPPISFRTPNSGPHLSALSDEELRDRLGRLGGTPIELLENDELMDLMLPIVRSDLTACEDYVYRPETPLPCPITALGGASDHTFDQSELTLWREMTSAEFEVVRIPGGHFFLSTHSAQLMKWLCADMLRMLSVEF